MNNFNFDVQSLRPSLETLNELRNTIARDPIMQREFDLATKAGVDISEHKKTWNDAVAKAKKFVEVYGNTK